ncbi:MAG: peptide chain release factor N(5)-glutamine methyltransferase [Candidatus Marinimicrobia bacterium]|nr:peptide chain release factor N(5)-glutamine methyltransferase [Candidatus Neomarinimicrobiota bacterium]
MTAGEPQQTWRVIDLINWGTDYFAKKNFENPRREIEWLLSDFLNCKRIDLYLRFDELFSRPMLNQFRAWVKRRVNHEPLQYISGRAEFYGLTFQVNRNVLIPRPETERLVEVVLELIGGDTAPRILEVGTGSGCIAVTLAKELPESQILTIDNSPAALDLARSNTFDNDVANIEFRLMDFLLETPETKFDFVVSNPPYIPQTEKNTLTPEVIKYEPESALTDDQDGLQFYHRFRDTAPGLIEPGGWLVLETGLGNHPQLAAAIFATEKFLSVELIKDYNKDDRVLKVQVK